MAERREFELLLQPLDHGEVEVIGRLVQQQNIRLGRQNTRQRGTSSFAAREGLRMLGAGKAERT
jgi:hypothetical protein